MKTALILAVAAALHPGQINFDGVSDVKIGMTVAQAEKRVGHRIEANYQVSPPCGTATLSKRDRVHVLLDGKRIKRIDVLGTRFRTARGVRVGDSNTKLLSRYAGKLVATRNFYSGDPQYEFRKGNRKLVFFTRKGKIWLISTGAKPEIDYIEGCA
jgi:hypothetical protein